MNILIITDYYPPGHLGGIGEVAAGLASAYRKLGHSIFVLTTGPEQPADKEHGILRSFSRLLPGVLLNNLLVRNLIRKQSIDLVHVQQASSTVFLMGRKRGKSPTILYTMHVTYAAEAAQITPYTLGGSLFRPHAREWLQRFITMPVHRFLDNLGMRHADIITTMSAQATAELRRFDVPVHVVPNGCNLPSTLPPPAGDPNLDSTIANRTVIAFSGSFRTRKRLPLLLLAMASLLQKRRDVALIVMGGGHGYNGSMRELAESLGLKEHICFTGHISQEQVLGYLQRSDIFCMVSTLEGMPVALIEAMRLGLAVIGTRAPGIEDAIRNEETGLLVDTDNVDQLAAQLERLVSDESLRRNLGSRANLYSTGTFSWDVIAHQYLDTVAEFHGEH
jgi:glycosyltransferase involved in cell wall biosynthesis